MRKIAFLGLLVSSVLISSAAHAGKISTPPILRSGTEEDIIQCVVANAGPKAVGPFDMTIYGADGSVATQSLGLNLNPNASTRVLAFDADLNGLSGFCRVEGQGISKRKTPVTICVTTLGLARCEASVSAP